MNLDEVKAQKQFFKACLDDLESLTGLRQLYFLQSDEDGKRKVEVLIGGMVEVSRKFHYIPLEAQQKIIRRMMVEDQSYDSLNSRTVHKWLDQHKDKYYTVASITEEELTPEKAPAPPEVADKYLEQFKANLANIGRPVPPALPEGETRKDPNLRGAVATMRPSAPAEDVRRWELHNEYLRTNYHHITGAKLPGWMSEEEWTKLQEV